jgi:hypothetical protein
LWAETAADRPGAGRPGWDGWGAMLSSSVFSKSMLLGQGLGPGGPLHINKYCHDLMSRSRCGPKQLLAGHGPAGRAVIAGELRDCLPLGWRARNGCGKERANSVPGGPLHTNKVPSLIAMSFCGLKQMLAGQGLAWRGWDSRGTEGVPAAGREGQEWVWAGTCQYGPGRSITHKQIHIFN